jgi:hypothetical protein
MSLGYGIGKGLENFGDSLMRIFMLRDENKQKAMDRALTEKRLDTQESQQEAQAQYYRDLAAGAKEKRALDRGKYITDNFSGQEASPEMVSGMRALDPGVAAMTFEDKRYEPMQKTPISSAASAELPGMPAELETMAPDVTAEKYLNPPMQTRVRKVETAQERMNNARIAAQSLTEQARQSWNLRKLQSDERWKQAANELGYERIRAAQANVGRQLEAMYAGQDIRVWEAMYDAEMDAELARAKAEGDNDPMKQLTAEIIRRNLGVQGGAAPTAPTTPRPIRTPNLPPPTRGGVRPPASPPASDPSDPLGIKKRPPQ